MATPSKEIKEVVAKHDNIPAERVETEAGIPGIQVQSTQVNATAGTAVNTTASLRQKTNAELAEETKNLQRHFSKEKTTSVSIPTVLQSKIGAVMYVAINGISINIPVDGEEHEVPTSFAKLVRETLKGLS